jgi:putative nucleotidyltransferase-like protein
LELLPPSIRNPDLLVLLGDILKADADQTAVPALRVRLMRPDFSWQALVDLAGQHDVLPPLIHALCQRSLLPPLPQKPTQSHDDHVTLRLQQCYRDHLARRRLQTAQLQDILRCLNRAGLVPLILKGARYVAAPLPAWSEARTFRDLDLLLRPGDADRAFAILVADGYRPGQAYMRDYHHLPDLEREGEPVSVEIHTAALSVAGQGAMSTDFVWRHAVKAADGSFFVLPAKWQALHCLLHHQLCDRGFARRILALKPLWEWTMLTRDCARDDWEDIEGHMRAAGALDLLGSWLTQAHRLFGASRPQLIAISAQAAQNAAETLKRASAPHWRRRTSFVVDQLRYALSKDTLAARYGKAPEQISLADAGRYLIRLLRQHRGSLLRRLAGHQDRLS